MSNRQSALAVGVTLAALITTGLAVAVPAAVERHSGGLWPLVAGLVASASVLIAFVQLTRVRRIQDELVETRRRLDTTSALDSSEEFYRELAEAVGRASASLDLTHVRNDPPEVFGPAAEKYSDNVLNWLSQDTSRSVRRLIAVRSAGMHVWAGALAKAVSEHPNFSVRVVDWPFDVAAINMAILDGDEVFLAITGGTPQRIGGLAFKDAVAAGFFAVHYNNLWNSAVDVREYLAAHPVWSTPRSGRP